MNINEGLAVGSLVSAVMLLLVYYLVKRGGI